MGLTLQFPLVVISIPGLHISNWALPPFTEEGLQFHSFCITVQSSEKQHDCYVLDCGIDVILLLGARETIIVMSLFKGSYSPSQPQSFGTKA